MSYTTTLRNERFVFADLRELLAKASEEKSGDQNHDDDEDDDDGVGHACLRSVRNRLPRARSR